jgi:hypothetical protein
MLQETIIPASDATNERRMSVRKRVLKGATLRFNKGYGALECVVRNLSDNGARLVFGETSGVPGKFSFALNDGDARDAHVVWRNMREIGIAFD